MMMSNDDGMDDEYELPMPVPPSKKKKKDEVKGWWYPSEIIVMFYDRKISPRDLVVLGVINSLTKTYRDGSTRACFANNKYIGERACVAAAHCSTIINKLIRLKIVRRYTESKKNGDTKRYLVPIWRLVKKGNRKTRRL